MSQPDSSLASAPRGVLVQRPRATIYTVLLAIALVAILLGCLFLWLEISAFGGFGAVKGRIAMALPIEGPDSARHLLA
ncbi:MAG: hypothetical protein WD851_25065 [Pirellulales bacterium]